MNQEADEMHRLWRIINAHPDFAFPKGPTVPPLDGIMVQLASQVAYQTEESVRSPAGTLHRLRFTVTGFCKQLLDVAPAVDRAELTVNRFLTEIFNWNGLGDRIDRIAHAILVTE